MTHQKKKLKLISMPYGARDVIAERTGVHSITVWRALNGMSNSVKSHEIRKAAKEYLKELKS